MRIWVLTQYQITNSIGLKPADVIEKASMADNIMPLKPIKIHKSKIANSCLSQINSYHRTEASKTNYQHTLPQ